MITKVSLRGLSKGCVAEVSVQLDDKDKDVIDPTQSDNALEEAIRVYEQARKYATAQTMRM